MGNWHLTAQKSAFFSLMCLGHLSQFFLPIIKSKELLAGRTLLHFVTTAKAECFLSDDGTKITHFPQVRIKAILPLYVCAQGYKRMRQPYIGKIWDYTSFCPAECAHRAFIVCFR